MRATKLAKLAECNCPLFLRQLREKTKTKHEQYSFCTPNFIISSFDISECLLVDKTIKQRLFSIF